MTYTLGSGIRENRRPFLEQLLQVFPVGPTIGLQRTVIPALAMGPIADTAGMLGAGFWFTGLAMAGSGLWLILRMEETHPRLNPTPQPETAHA
ncbi:MAG: hypothetical protein ACYC10_20790 [Allorhizobium sp.]